MKKLIVLAGLLLLSSVVAIAQSADAINGVWLNAEKDGTVEIYKSADKYYGKINWTMYPYEKDGKTPNKDDRNPDPALKGRPIIGLVVLNDLSYDGTAWTGGTAYDPKSGKTYKCRMKLNGDKLEIRGYIGKPILGVTTVWTRK